MNAPHAEKIARNNSVFRDANEEIEAAASDFGLAPENLSPFICECSDPRCLQLVRMTLEEYRRVRGDPRWFVHALDHEEAVEGAVRAIERYDTYTVVEKIGIAGAEAAALAPKPRQA